MDLNITGIDPIIYTCMVKAARIGVDFEHFLHSFSPSQVESKMWLVETLSIIPIKEPQIQLFGGWNGILITRLLIQNLNNVKKIHNIDLDEKSIEIFLKYRWETQDEKREKRLYGTLGDVRTPHKYDSSIDIVINSSSEHMPDLKEIIKDKEYKPECLFALQSNNMFYVEDHINCVNNEQELVEKSGLSKIIYKGSLDMSNGYKRFMVIGYA